MGKLTAAFLSFVFLGLGQIYNLDWEKAITIWIFYLIIFILLWPFEGLVSILASFVYFWSILDAYINAYEQKTFKSYSFA